MSVVEGSEEVDRPPRRTPTLCLMSTVVLGDAQHPGKLTERGVLLDLSIGACSAMHPHIAPVMGIASPPTQWHPPYTGALRVHFGPL